MAGWVIDVYDPAHIDWLFSAAISLGIHGLGVVHFPVGIFYFRLHNYRRQEVHKSYRQGQVAAPGPRDHLHFILLLCVGGSSGLGLVGQPRLIDVLYLMDRLGYQQLVLDHVHVVYRDALFEFHQSVAPVWPGSQLPLLLRPSASDHLHRFLRCELGGESRGKAISCCIRFICRIARLVRITRSACEPYSQDIRHEIKWKKIDFQC